MTGHRWRGVRGGGPAPKGGTGAERWWPWRGPPRGGLAVRPRRDRRTGGPRKTVGSRSSELGAELSFLCQASVYSSVLSHHNKDLECRTLKPSECHSSLVLDRACYSS